MCLCRGVAEGRGRSFVFWGEGIVGTAGGENLNRHKRLHKYTHNGVSLMNVMKCIGPTLTIVCLSLALLVGGRDKTH